MVFSPNMITSDRRSFLDIVQVEKVVDLGKYLGMPSTAGRNKKAAFKVLKERLWNCINGWNGKFLPIAGKEVLMKVMGQAIPTFIMSCFKLPNSLVTELNCLIVNFWWGKMGGGRGHHWVRWIDLCASKGQGGLGFRDFKYFKDALLTKQAWRIATNPNALVGRILKVIYFTHSSFLEDTIGNNPSLIWRSIMKSKEVLLKGVYWRIGNGEKINASLGRWIPRESRFLLMDHGCLINPSTTVSELINWEKFEWNIPLLQGKVNEMDLELIKQIPIPRSKRDDTLSWFFTDHRDYTVRSGYMVAWRAKNEAFLIGGHSHPSQSPWKEIWRIEAPPKIRIFLWRACKGILLPLTLLVILSLSLSQQPMLS